MALEWTLLGLLTLLLLGGLWFLQRRERTPSALWMGGWIAAGLGGLLTLLAPTRPALGLLA
ncbi:MAG: hypothetical protein ACREI8_13245, partial [Myxococcota bacterium]